MRSTSIHQSLTGLVTLSAATYTFSLILEDADNKDNSARQFTLDDVALNLTTTPVPEPEPSSTALLELGGLALILHRRK